MNFSEGLRQRLSPYFAVISKAFTNLENDMKTTLNGIAFVYRLESKLKEEILHVLVSVPLHFTQSDDEKIDQPSQLANFEISQTNSVATIETLAPLQHWTSSNIHEFNLELLAPFSSIYTNIATNYTFHGYVYALSNNAMPNPGL